jgi:hypothetical protein
MTASASTQKDNGRKQCGAECGKQDIQFHVIYDEDPRPLEDTIDITISTLRQNSENLTMIVHGDCTNKNNMVPIWLFSVGEDTILTQRLK